MTDLNNNIKILVTEKPPKLLENDKNKEIINSKKENTEQKVIIKNKSNKNTNCLVCNKKLKLTAIKCKCENYYCDFHRYSDRHNCEFDYKSSGKVELEKKNPTICPVKINIL